MIRARVRVPVSAPAAFVALFGSDRWACWLDSARAEPGLARWSFLGSPGRGGEVLTYAVGRGHVDVLRPGRGDDPAGSPGQEPGTIFDALRRRLSQDGGPSARGADGWDPRSWEAGLVDGWVGYLGYELKADLGSDNRHVSPHPDAVWLRCERMLALDHESGDAWLVGHGDDAERWVAEAQHLLAAAPQDRGPSARRDPHAGPRPGDGGDGGHGVRLVRDEATYRQDVESCLAALRRGESWEICLTDTVLAPLDGDPFDAYLRLRAHNPAPHAAYLRLDGLHVLSASPELFLHATRDGWVSTKPIKGTVARHTDPVADEEAARALAADRKTRAENLIIVDLLRNDLSRVCDPATVQVPALMAIESYATVHQLVTTVRARLHEGRTVVDAVEACFPAGSMTGAPKHRTMEIIDALETRARGVYSGAIGYLDRGGAADLSVVIRTAVVEDGRAEIGAGGAVVLDSDPQAETDEMLLKARSVLPALTGAVPAWGHVHDA